MLHDDGKSNKVIKARERERERIECVWSGQRDGERIPMLLQLQEEALHEPTINRWRGE